MSALVLLLDALVAGALFGRKRARWMFPAAFAALVLGLVATSKPRVVGDSAEYIAMSLNMAHFSAPSLSTTDLKTAAPYISGVNITDPDYRGSDGRQDMPHFWFYSLLAAPFVRVALLLGRVPIAGFTVLNALLLLAAAIALERNVSAAVAAFVVAGPILWWVDKAHTEAFTVSLLAIAVALLAPAPWWSIVALGAASTQNPPIAAAMIIVAAWALGARGWRERRLWIASAAGGVLALLHPLYYQARLGMWSGLSIGLDRHLPTSRELLAVLTDPNLGILVHDPFLTLAVITAFFVAWLRRPAGLLRGRHVAVMLIALLFLVSFTQAGNFNSGGTPSVSRYGLWLIPLAVGVLATSATSAWMRVLAVTSVIWCSVFFAPSLAEEYLKPTPLAATIWHRWPDLDNPMAEVFTERVSGREPPPKPPIATSGCEKVLLVGNGTTAAWPATCAPPTISIPSECRESGALCYANRTLTAYSFTKADAQPTWLVWERRPADTETAHADVLPSSFQLPPAEPPGPSFWLADGWSYVEQEPGTGGDTISWRWMGDRASLVAVMPAPTRARLRVVVRSFRRPRTLKLSLGHLMAATLRITESRAQYETPPLDLVAGQNVITLESVDGSESPGGDTRHLSIALFHVEIVP
jgi:hypothetical protein